MKDLLQFALEAGQLVSFLLDLLELPTLLLVVGFEGLCLDCALVQFQAQRTQLLVELVLMAA